VAVVATVLALAAATLGAVQEEPAPDGSSERLEVQRLVFLLQYVGADYGLAVDDGRIVDAFEFQEVSTFATTLVERFDVLRRAGAPEEALARLHELRRAIREMRPWNEVRGTTTDVASMLLREIEVVAMPTARPEPRRGRALYPACCAPCHGPTGGGDGTANPWLSPPATSFRDDRMNLLSPHQVFGAITFGIGGTGMPSYLEALTPQQAWDLAFYVLTLREDFAPVAEDPGLGPTLEEVTTLSNVDLAERLGSAGRPAPLAEIDHYRRSPPPFRLPEVAASRPAPRGTRDDRPPLAPTDALGVALGLQDAFVRVADDVLPGVVTITAYVHADRPVEETGGAPAWRTERLDALIYPGFRRLRSGSGFFVSDEGHVLTCYSAIADDDGDPPDAIDVELPNGEHMLGRLVGAEPTVNLAVVRLALEFVAQNRKLPPIEPLAIGDDDAARIGQWTIALGDPWGPERTFAVGTLSALPSRQCYQEELAATLLQSSLTVHPESYGGPLVDIHGRVLGLTVPAPRSAPGLQRTAEFALPIDLAVNLYEALVLAETTRSPWLGFSVLDFGSVLRRHRDDPPPLPRGGIYIDDVFDPSPAADAGLRVGDCLVAIDGIRLLTVLEFQKWLYLSGIGRTVRLEIFRDGEMLERHVTIEERPGHVTPR